MLQTLQTFHPVMSASRPHGLTWTDGRILIDDVDVDGDRKMFYKRSRR